jgi:hypothetical protein
MGVYEANSKFIILKSHLYYLLTVYIFLLILNYLIKTQIIFILFRKQINIVFQFFIFLFFNFQLIYLKILFFLYLRHVCCFTKSVWLFFLYYEF